MSRLTDLLNRLALLLGEALLRVLITVTAILVIVIILLTIGRTK